jgi:hypothetical protein
MTKLRTFVRHGVSSVRRFLVFIHPALLGFNPYEEQVKWDKFHRDTQEMPEVIQAAVDEHIRAKRISRFLSENRN